MLPNLTSEFLVVLKTDCNGANSTIGEIGIIKGLEDYLKHARDKLSVFEVGSETLDWKDPEWLDAVVTEHLLDRNGEPLTSVNEVEYWQILKDPDTTALGYQIEICESLEGIMMDNRSVLQDLANNYVIERWDILRNLPNHMVLLVTGARVK